MLADGRLQKQEFIMELRMRGITYSPAHPAIQATWLPWALLPLYPWSPWQLALPHITRERMYVHKHSSRSLFGVSFCGLLEQALQQNWYLCMVYSWKHLVWVTQAPVL